MDNGLSPYLQTQPTNRKMNCLIYNPARPKITHGEVCEGASAGFEKDQSQKSWCGEVLEDD